MDGAEGAFAAMEPEACANLAEVRAGIDEVDGRLIELLARRLAYCERTSKLKAERAQVRDEARIAQVIGNALARGAQKGLPPEIVAPIWRAIIDAFVAHELWVFDAQQTSSDWAAHLSVGRPWAT